MGAVAVGVACTASIGTLDVVVANNDIPGWRAFKPTTAVGSYLDGGQRLIDKLWNILRLAKPKEKGEWAACIAVLNQGMMVLMSAARALLLRTVTL